jgi:hypothetical protein
MACVEEPPAPLPPATPGFGWDEFGELDYPFKPNNRQTRGGPDAGAPQGAGALQEDSAASAAAAEATKRALSGLAAKTWFAGGCAAQRPAARGAGAGRVGPSLLTAGALHQGPCKGSCPTLPGPTPSRRSTDHPRLINQSHRPAANNEPPPAPAAKPHTRPQPAPAPPNPTPLQALSWMRRAGRMGSTPLAGTGA